MRPKLKGAAELVAGWLAFAAIVAALGWATNEVACQGQRARDAYRAAAKPVPIPGRATGPGPLAPARATGQPADEIYEDEVIEFERQKETKP